MNKRDNNQNIFINIILKGVVIFHFLVFLLFTIVISTFGLTVPAFTMAILIAVIGFVAAMKREERKDKDYFDKINKNVFAMGWVPGIWFIIIIIVFVIFLFSPAFLRHN